MKVKLLKKLRRRGRNVISIYSVTTTNGTPTGMKYTFSGDSYSRLFEWGDTEEDVYKKAERIYIENYIKTQRAKQKR